MSLTQEQLVALTLGLEARIREALKEATDRVAPDPDDRLLLASGVVVLLLRHTARAQPDMTAWLERAVTAVLQP